MKVRLNSTGGAHMIGAGGVGVRRYRAGVELRLVMPEPITIVRDGRKWTVPHVSCYLTRESARKLSRAMRATSQPEGKC